MGNDESGPKLPRGIVAITAIVGIAGTLSTIFYGWQTLQIEKFKSTEENKLESLKAKQANDLETMKERHADTRARAELAADMKKTLWRDAVDAKAPFEQRLSTLRLIQAGASDTYAPDPAFIDWAKTESAALENARAAAVAQPPLSEIRRCAENVREPCSNGTVFACVVGFDRDNMAGKTIKTTDPAAIVFGQWANSECGTNGSGWHMKLGSCSVGGGSLYKPCTEVLARVQARQAQP